MLCQCAMCLTITLHCVIVFQLIDGYLMWSQCSGETSVWLMTLRGYGTPQLPSTTVKLLFLVAVMEIYSATMYNRFVHDFLFLASVMYSV